MKIGAEQTLKIAAGPHAGQPLVCRTVWLQPGERVTPAELLELQQVLERAHPGQRCLAQARVSAFTADAADAAPAADEEAAT